MNKIVMTLLVRRVPEENVRYPFAVQIAMPEELMPGASSAPAAARLINAQGAMASVLETMDFYHPHEWRAALLHEQAQYVAAFNGNPKPWYCVMRSLTRNVYDFAGSGDRDRNNGQVWDEIGQSDEGWSTEGNLRRKCKEELDADWNRRIAQVTGVQSPGWQYEQYSASLKRAAPQGGAH